MTEIQAYQVLGWPIRGKGLVLPASGSDRQDWLAVKCTNCNYSGISVPEAYDVVCVGCGKPSNSIYGRPD
jgi:hypothetical protein